MDPASPPLFKSLASDTFQAVGPSRIAVLTIAAMREEDLEREDRRGVAEEASTRIERAYEMLHAGFAAGLRSAGLAEPTDLRERREAALAVLLPVVEALREGTSPTARILGDAEAFRALCLDKLDPVITRFLDTMTAMLEEAHVAHSNAAKRETMTSIQAAGTLGRSIRMIAINATIEAARSGSEGHGFMVIAREMRSLADRTQTLLDEVARRVRA